MNGNSSKQVLLSVLGIAVLVVAVVGVSFAFFTYSRQGTENNVLTTGSIFFDFAEGKAISLSNQFPVSDAVGSALPTVEGGDNAELTFTIVGWDGSGTGIDYTVTAYEGGTVSGKTARLRDSEIKLLLTDQSENYTTTASEIVNNFEEAAVVGTDDSLANGVVLATGRISAEEEANKQTDTYSLRMWITSDVVKLASGDDGQSNPATHTYSADDFADLYYSLRVDVTAATTTGTGV